MIGIVGGVGPFAGIDLEKKILINTKAVKDQDYISVIHASLPKKISDRTEFLLGNNDSNPGHEIARIAGKLADFGAKVIGIPCNTSHAEPIFSVVCRIAKNASAKDAGKDVRILNMIEEVAEHIPKRFPDITKVGLLATNGTVKSKIYHKELGRKNIEVLVPNKIIQKLVHESIYDEDIGIKSQGYPVTDAVMTYLRTAIMQLKEQGAEAIILGCTELPLAITESILPLIDSTDVLAKALVREHNRMEEDAK